MSTEDIVVSSSTVCANCGKEGANNVCAKCKSVRYCSNVVDTYFVERGYRLHGLSCAHVSLIWHHISLIHISFLKLCTYDIAQNTHNNLVDILYTNPVQYNTINIKQ